MFARILGGVGRILITAGTLILLFVAYQLWGTNLQTASSQRALDKQFEQLSAQAAKARETTTTTTTAPGTPTSDTLPVRVAPTLPPPAAGDLIGQISIPRIGLRDFKFVQGVSVAQLKRGAGHYPDTPLPGQAGNAAIAGHRTTYGAPFHNIDKVEVGDTVTIDTLLQGTFTYKVISTTIVKPGDTSVLQDFGDNRLTLTACHPKFSASRRIVIAAELVGNPVPKVKGQDAAAASAIKESGGGDGRNTIEGLNGKSSSKAPAIWWGLACAGIWLVAWVIARFALGRDRGLLVRNLPYAVLLLPFLVCLYFFFENFALLLPSSY